MKPKKKKKLCNKKKQTKKGNICIHIAESHIAQQKLT